MMDKDLVLACVQTILIEADENIETFSKLMTEVVDIAKKLEIPPEDLPFLLNMVLVNLTLCDRFVLGKEQARETLETNH